jgi:hypothetical protein
MKKTILIFIVFSTVLSSFSQELISKPKLKEYNTKDDKYEEKIQRDNLKLNILERYYNQDQNMEKNEKFKKRKHIDYCKLIHTKICFCYENKEIRYIPDENTLKLVILDPGYKPLARPSLDNIINFFGENPNNNWMNQITETKNKEKWWVPKIKWDYYKNKGYRPVIYFEYVHTIYGGGKNPLKNQ